MTGGDQESGILHPATRTTLAVTVGAVTVFLAGQAWLLGQLFGIRADFRDLSKDVQVIRGELGAMTRAIEAQGDGAVSRIEFEAWLVALKASNPELAIPDRVRR